MQDTTFVYQADKSQEWYTPARYIEASRRVMGGIELDPASCEYANRTVQAERYYTRADNGLAQEWKAQSVWLNPPYGRSLDYDTGNIGQFTSKLLQEYRAGNVEQAILLVTTQTTARWFQPLWQYPLCFTDHKVHFHTTKPTRKSPTATHMFGTAFVYFGSHLEAFIQEFSAFGVIVPGVVRSHAHVQLSIDDALAS